MLSGSCIVAESSSTVRRHLADALAKQGLEVIQVASVAEMMHTLSKVKIPDYFIISNSFDDGAGRKLALGLAAIGKTRRIPVALIGAASAGDLPINITSLQKFGRIDDIVGALQSSRTSVDTAGDELSAPELDPEVQESITQGMSGISAVDQALKLFATIVDRIKKNKVPGPIMPSFMREVQELIGSSQTTFGDLGEFVKKHQSASARLLGMANSAYFRKTTGQRITNIEEAVQRIGLRQVGQLLQAVAMQAFLVGKDPALREMIARNLRRGLYVAYSAETLGNMQRHADPGFIYTSGLFHNIGTTFFVYTVALLFDEGKIPEVDSTQVETALETRGVLLNRLISSRLEFPQEVAKILVAVGGTAPEADEEGEVQEDPNVTLIRQAMWVGEQLLKEVTELEPNVECEIVGLSQETLEQLNRQLPSIVETVKQLYSTAGS